MKHELIKLGSFKIVGISVRTKNADRKAAKDIGMLWKKWFSEDISSKIANKLSDDTYNLYYDYESDHNSEYSVLLGCLVASFEDLGEGLSAQDFPLMNYAKYSSKGKVPDIVVKTWEKIYKEKYERAYTCDFDLYKANQTNSKKMLLETYVSIK